MDSRRRSDTTTKAVGAPGDDRGNDDVDDDDDNNAASSGFTGFSEAQLTRLRRFYNDAAPTGSDGKPIRGNDDGDEKTTTTTSLAANRTPFNLATDVNQSEYGWMPL